MQVGIGYVADNGDPDRERLVLHVKRNTDIGDFLLIRAGVENGDVTTNVSDSFWFPDRLVRVGDLVVVYTKSGFDRAKKIDGDGRAHFFYWDREAPLWDDAAFGAVLLHVRDWVSNVA